MGLVLILTGNCKKEDTSTCPVPTLISPKNNAILDNGCTPPEVDTIKWSFEWTGCPNATNYNLYVKHPFALYPAIDIETKESNFISSDVGYIGDISNWEYKVRAFVDGEWREWSEVRIFELEQPNSDCME